MNFNEIGYEELFSYKSPFADYISDIYYDGSSIHDLTETAVYAIIYAYENDIEYVDFPIEFGMDTLKDAWELAALTYPNVPCAISGSEYDLSEAGNIRLRLSDSVRQCASSEQTLKTAREIVDSIPAEYTTDAQKAYYLYDWVCSNVVYDMYHADNGIGMVNASPQSAYGALVEKRAVCDGIAGGLQLLFELAGIPCSKLTGMADRENSHVWNTAEIDGEVWDFDATWDICRFCYAEGSEITEEENEYGGYAWFGCSRGAKAKLMVLDNVGVICAPPTPETFSAKSPALMAYDYCITSGGNVFTAEGQISSTTMAEQLGSALSEGKSVRIAFDSSDAVVHYLAALLSQEQIFEKCSNSELVSFLNSDMQFMILSMP